MIEVHVYGKLRRHIAESATEGDAVLHIEPRPNETLSALLARLEIPRDELYHVFLNGSLLATHNSMAPWLAYPQAQKNVFDWETDVPLKAGDRLGLFGEDMASLVV